MARGDVVLLPHILPRTFFFSFLPVLPLLNDLHSNQQRSICSYASQFAGSEQHDSQEFLSWLLDGLHEDLNRIIAKPNYEVTPEREAELEKLPQQIASEQEWRIYRMRNDSIVVDFFQGQFRNRLECMTCHKVCSELLPSSQRVWIGSWHGVDQFRAFAVLGGRLRRRTTLSCISNFRYRLRSMARSRCRTVSMLSSRKK